MTPPLTPSDEQHQPRDAADAGFGPPEDDELVRRLRSLTWPEISPETRERCWEQFRQRIGEHPDQSFRHIDAP